MLDFILISFFGKDQACNPFARHGTSAASLTQNHLKLTVPLAIVELCRCVKCETGPACSEAPRQATKLPSSQRGTAKN